MIVCDYVGIAYTYGEKPFKILANTDDLQDVRVSLTREQATDLYSSLSLLLGNKVEING